MSRLKIDTERFMAGPVADGPTLTARFRFAEDYLGFQGHFPGSKILPGACQIQCALSAIERGEKSPVRLREVVLAKFYAPVLPEEEVTCTLKQLERQDGSVTFKASLAKEGTKVTELKLRVSLVGAKREGGAP